MKKIIIAEKPSVGRIYASILGVTESYDGYMESDEWIVTWGIGHLVTLAYPEEYDEELKRWSMQSLPFLPQKYKYRVIDSVKKQFNVIKKLYNRKDISAIYYAGDSGREGIYIQTLIRNQAGHNPNAKELVVWIDSQTKEEILRGIKEAKPLSEYQNLINSGYMRAIEDYALGINFSRALTLKYQNIINASKPISVGRVMTCVLGMVVNRECEILNFTPTKYYKVHSVINVDGEDIVATWKPDKENPGIKPEMLYGDNGFKNKEDAKEFVLKLSDELSIEKVESKTEKKSAPLLFNLAELQATCSRLLHISPDKTLEVAQSLYEKRMITYPRTDARVLSSAIAREAEHNLNGLKGYSEEIKGFVNEIFENPKGISWIEHSKYTDDSKITDHYALIPTGENVYNRLSELEEAVYDLIIRRFVSIFMPPAEYKKLVITEKDEKTNERFFAAGSTLVKPGFLACAGMPLAKSSLPESAGKLKQGERYNSSYKISEGETKPPSRYTTGTIVLAMENAGNLIEDDELREQIKGSGIGTSATRAEVIKKLVTNEYLSVNNKTQVITPVAFGCYVYEIVNSVVPALLNPKMTANWERGLEKIANGEMPVTTYLDKLNQYIIEKIKVIKTAPIEEDFKESLLSYKDKIPVRKSQNSIKAGCYLKVPYDEKDKAKALGAKWNSDKKMWYVPEGKETAPFKKWIEK